MCNEKIDRWDIAQKTLDDYYDSFPKQKPSAFFLIKFVFDIMYSLYDIREYNELIIHEKIFEVYKNNYQDDFIQKFMKHFSYRYCVAFNQMFSDDIDNAKYEFYRIGMLDSVSSFNHTALLYKPDEKIDIEEILNKFIENANSRYNISVSQEQCLNFIYKFEAVVASDLSYNKYVLIY